MKETLKSLGFFILIFGFITLFSVQVYAVLKVKIKIEGGSITLTISTATAGQEPNEVTNTTCGLEWECEEWEVEKNKKITVKTNLVSPKFTLKVLAIIDPTSSGTAAGEVTLSTVAQDFVTSIPAGSEVKGSCTLKYTASATAAQGTGTDTHIITYTITTQ